MSNYARPPIRRARRRLRLRFLPPFRCWSARLSRLSRRRSPAIGATSPWRSESPKAFLRPVLVQQGAGLSAGPLGHDAADVDQVVGNHPEADPALDTGIPIGPAATQSMPSFAHADATLAAGPPFLQLAAPPFNPHHPDAALTRRRARSPGDQGAPRGRRPHGRAD